MKNIFGALLKYFQKDKLIFALICLLFTINSCYYEAGTLGGGSVYKFDCSRNELQYELESINNKIPDKWKRYNDWHERGYDFLNGIVFYFKMEDGEKEEMYYVSLVKRVLEDTAFTKPSYVSIRAVFSNDDNKHHWKHMDDLNKDEYARVEKRFKREILDKLRTNSCFLIKEINHSDWLDVKNN